MILAKSGMDLNCDFLLTVQKFPDKKKKLVIQKSPIRTLGRHADVDLCFADKRYKIQNKPGCCKSRG